ncbi:MAG: prenyltransferase [Clostridia bacterium]|nr:prenyltransferase [Clostridia bacterium]
MASAAIALTWLKAMRPGFHTVGVAPFILGTVIAVHSGHPWNGPVFCLGLTTVILIMLATYLLGEYFDYEGDAINRSYNRFSGGSRAFQGAQGLSPRLALYGGASAAALAVLTGLCLLLYYRPGPLVLPLGTFGFVSGVFYSTKPFRWVEKGIGELLIGICYGWLPVNTGFYLLAGKLTLTPTLVSMPIAFSITAVILINEFPDLEADRLTAKKNLVVRLGPEAAIRLYAGILLLAALTLAYNVLLTPSWTLAALCLAVAALVAINLVYITRKQYIDPRILEQICGTTLAVNLLISTTCTAYYLFSF